YKRQIVNGLLLRKNKSALGFPLVLVGVGYVGFAVLLFSGFSQVALFLELFLLPVQVVWLGIFGLSLLQR
ncbi:DUF4386 domain-containing protein, partial [Acinetobacter baumannii]